MSGLSEEQIQYLRDVLGVESLVLGPQVLQAFAAQATQPVSPPISEIRMKGDLKSAKLLVVSHGERTFTLDGEAGDLAAKMIQAMKLSSQDVVIVEWTAELPDDVRDAWNQWKGLALSFGEQAAAQLTGSPTTSGTWIESGARRIMVSDSPKRLLVEPERKKIAWAHLQQVMKALS